MKAYNILVLICLSGLTTGSSSSSSIVHGSIPIPSGCSVFDSVLNGYHPYHPTNLIQRPLHPISLPIEKRFIIPAINFDNIMKVARQTVLDSIKPTLPGSMDIWKHCKISLKTTSQKDLDFIRAMAAKHYKVCVMCDQFDTNITTCETLGFCPSNSMCYRGYSDDRKFYLKSPSYNIFDAWHPKAVFHGCCRATDSNCRNLRYTVKNIHNKKLNSANYTTRLCSSVACNGDDGVAISKLVHTISKVDGHWTSWGHWGHCTVTCGSGTRTRHRSCTNPAPSVGGKSCVGLSVATSHCTASVSCPVDGHWASWGHWEHCSATCGSGTRSRHRLCTNPAPSGGGKSCSGLSVKTGSCTASVACPVDGHWASWSHWGQCTATCGSGKRTRQRSCTNPSPSGGGKNCVGLSVATLSCSTLIACPVDGHWAYWSTWGHCTATCGLGTRIRRRSCTKPAPTGGGKSCSGLSVATKSCTASVACPVDGHWTSWSNWGHCTATCGSGTRSQQRSCTNPAPSGGGKNCTGLSVTTSHCTASVACPVNGKWSHWNAWGTCSVTCGDGKKTRARSCTNPAPAHGGTVCVGTSSESHHCGHPCIINGGWSSWQVWSKCSKTCLAGTRSRARTCSNPAPANGGKDCGGDRSLSENCNNGPCPEWSRWFYDACSVTCGNGTTTRMRHCSSGKDPDCGSGKPIESVSCSERECPIDGHWISWSHWGHCTATCGSGTRSRHRSCTNPAPSGGGKSCTGLSVKTSNCTASVACPVNGKWSHWNAWGTCSVTCGDGKQTRARSCTNPAPAHGGIVCVGTTSASRRCGHPCIVNGGWSNWHVWSKCSKSCTAGTRSRARTCSHPAPANGGNDCVGDRSVTENCNNGPCPVDGSWGTWNDWSKCSATCGEGRHTRSRVCNDPPLQNGGADCSGSKAETAVCNTQHCPLNGKWSHWNAWGTCSVTCGDGKQTRARSCTNPAPAHGGTVCLGTSSESRHCGHPCIVNGGWSNWQVWSKCSKSCTAGTRSRARTCSNPAPANGGKHCVGSGSLSENCNNGPCPEWSRWFYDACSVTCGNGTTMRMRHCSSGKDPDCGSGKAIESTSCSERPCPIDGSWGTWNDWSKCTATCGEGQHTRSRVCNDPHPQNGGADCSGSKGETAVCNTQDCPHWLPYNEMGACSVTCGKGFIQMKRNCSTGTQSDCAGGAFNEKTCILSECV